MALKFLQNRRLRRFLLGLLAVLAIWGIYRLTRTGETPPEMRPQAVQADTVRVDSVPVYLPALGTVTSPNTVTVRSRVDGELMALHFAEGQLVKAGDLLAEIDPRPYEVQKAQAEGNLARDEALLQDARLDLERYRKLIREQSVSAQQLQAQEALVGQYEGAVRADRAAVDEAELQITYSRVTAPLSGRVGLRRVDVGNIVRSSDADGLVVITQMQPMHVIFTLVEKQLPEVLEPLRAGIPLAVEVRGQDNRTPLASGVLLTIDNQIDTATGTVRAKAEFPNYDERLFPNQFVNVRLRVRTLDSVLVVPSSAVQRNNQGAFVYVVQEGRTGMRPITAGYATDTVTVVESGLRPGEIVVTDGVDRLREGSAVSYLLAGHEDQGLVEGPSGPPPGMGGRGGEGRPGTGRGQTRGTGAADAGASGSGQAADTGSALPAGHNTPSPSGSAEQTSPVHDVTAVAADPDAPAAVDGPGTDGSPAAADLPGGPGAAGPGGL